MSIHSWRVFLFLCAVPSFVGGILCIIMPEGPRYLLEVRREREGECVCVERERERGLG